MLAASRKAITRALATSALSSAVGFEPYKVLAFVNRKLATSAIVSCKLSVLAVLAFEGLQREKGRQSGASQIVADSGERLFAFRLPSRARSPLWLYPASLLARASLGMELCVSDLLSLLFLLAPPLCGVRKQAHSSRPLSICQP